MGSIGNPNPWAPYKDCSQGICSMYCPQWCYIIFPPPPPPPLLSDDDSATPFSPLVYAVIGVVASAVILVSYYTIVTGYCRRRNDPNTSVVLDGIRDEANRDRSLLALNGLDEALIKTITVFKYKKVDGLIKGTVTDCSVCLSEFEENESLRLLPNCSHAFHLPCIDTWLKSHANCPLCRANVTCTNAVSLSTPNSQYSPVLDIASLEIQGSDDLIVVVDDRDHDRYRDRDRENDRLDEIVVNPVTDDTRPKSPRQVNTNAAEDSESRNSNTARNADPEDVKNFTRSDSLGSFSTQNEL